MRPHCIRGVRPMSALGRKRTLRNLLPMSALPPNSGRCIAPQRMSALCQKHALQQTATLLDHLIGTTKQRCSTHCN
jgi:hypothetical protein